MDASFLDHFDRELAYLREMGAQFASRYPKLAGRLGLDEFQCSDPFVERLLEGFAFMSARVQRRMDAEYPQLTNSIFDAVYPRYTRPIPSAGIFQINPNVDEGSLIDGYRLPTGTRLFSEPSAGEQTGCRFDTTTDLDLWPIKIARVHHFSRDETATLPLPRVFHQSHIRAGLWITLELTVAVAWEQLKMDRLRLHFRGGEMAHQVFETLLTSTSSLSVAGGDLNPKSTPESWIALDPNQMAAVGCDASEALFPDDCRSFSGYRLLQEYFLLPEKFLFIDIHGLQSALKGQKGNQLHLVFGLEQSPGKLIPRVSKDHVALHCVPAINLFRKRADRIHVDHAKHEHHLVADRSRPRDFEIWSIQEMAAHASASALESPCLPLYSPMSVAAESPRHAFYYSVERRPRLVAESPGESSRSSYPGSEIFVSLTDAQQDSKWQDIQQLSSSLYCTNRDLPLIAPDGGWRNAFQAEAAGPIANVICITGPTHPRTPLVNGDGESAWRLVSHLTPNYLSLVDNQHGGATMLREMLSLYCCPTNHSSLRQIEGIRHIHHQNIVRRLPMPGPMTFGRGVEITLECDEDAFEGGGAFLLGSILNQFMSRFVSLNSFTETVLTSLQRGCIHRWPAQIGKMINL